MPIVIDGTTPGIEVDGSGAVVTVTVTTGSGGGGGGVTDHGLLTGLSDDDHSQYALADGSRGAFATAAQGTDARTPTAHKTTHATGGTDALTAADIGAAASSHVHAAADITSGTLDAARLATGTATDNFVITSNAGVPTWEAAAGGGTVDVVSNVAADRILGRTTAGSGDSEELTAAQTRALLDVQPRARWEEVVLTGIPLVGLPGVHVGAPNTTFTLVANTLYYFAWVPGFACTITNLCAYVSTGVAASNMHLGLTELDPADLQPAGNVLAESGDLSSAASATFHDHTITGGGVAVTPDKVYALTLQSSGALVMQAPARLSNPLAMILWPFAGGSNRVSLTHRLTRTYAGFSGGAVPDWDTQSNSTSAIGTESFTPVLTKWSI